MKSKINYLWLLIILSLSGINFAISQEYTSTSKEEFLSYVQQQDTYYQNLIEQNNGSTEGIDGYKAYMRWKARYSEEAYNSNGMYNVLLEENIFNKNFSNYNRRISSEQVEWEELGPFQTPKNYRPNSSYNTWPKGVGRIFSIEFDPTNTNRVFAGSPTGGLYYSEDHGATWTNAGTDQLPNPGISHMQIIPASGNTPETWFILTGDGDNAWSYCYGVFRSQNQGQSWESISTVLDTVVGVFGRKMLQNKSNPNEMFVIMNKGLFKTNNALGSSVNWSEIEDDSFSDTHFTDICYKPNSNYQTIYLASRDSIFISDNAGQSFSGMPNLDETMFLPDSLLGNSRITLRTTPANSQILYAAIINDTSGSEAIIYKFNENNNNDWVQKSQIMPYMEYYGPNDSAYIEAIGYGRYQGFAVSSVNENILYKSRVQYVDKSEDGGETWVHLSDDKHDDTHWICFENNDPNKIWLGTDGGLYFTQNDFTTIIDKTNGIGVANIEKVSGSNRNPNEFIMGAYDCGINLFLPDTNDWGIIYGGDGFKGLICDKNVDTAYYHAGSSSGIPRRFPTTLYSHGSQWWPNEQNTIIKANGFGHSMTKDYLNNNLIYYAGHNQIGRSLDNSHTWEPISPLANEDTIFWIRYRHIENCATDRDVLYVTKIKNHDTISDENFQIWKTTNCRDAANDVEWTDVSPVFGQDTLRQWCGDIAIDGNNTNRFWASYGGYTNNSKIIYFDGNIWQNLTNDPNNTLDGLSVSQVEWVGRPDNMLLLGTNCGVYYKTDNMANWVKLQGIPNVRVKEIVLQPEINKFLVATYGRGVWRGSIPCDIAGGDIVINSNTTWNSDQLIPNELIIEPGATLTINNSQVTFATQKRLIVKNGAKLVLNNSTLNSRCAEKWAGIEVWGDTSHTQTETYQGKIEMYNSTIKNAHEAVQLWKPNDYAKTGGMIYAENSTFRNNRRAISILSYKNIHPVFGIESDYAANFKRCTFKNDKNYFPDNPFHTFVSMWDVRGVKFKACNFDAGSFEQSAIYTIDAGFKVESICNGAIGPDGCLPQDLERCEFYGFDKAIEVKNIINDDLYPINIQHAYFFDNNYGIWAYNLFNVLNVKTSEFIIGKHGTNKEKQICGNFFGRGIHVQASTGFFIENNSFAPVSDANLSDDLMGIIAMDNPSNHDIIKNNIFSNLFVGNHAYGDNRRDDGLFGIEYQCNQNSLNKIDFEVVGDDDNPGKINTDIGAINLSARNSFSSGKNQWHWRNMGQEDQYYFIHSTEATSIYEPDSLKIETYNNDNTFIKEAANNLNECDDDGGIHEERLVLTPQEQEDLESQYAIANSEYAAVESIYNDLSDGGNTAGTTLSIETAQPGDTWELRDNLLGMSPYLSRTVLEKAANKTEVLPNSVLLDILAANPDELKKNDFIRFLENKEEPLPAYMIEILEDLSSGTTYKTALLRQMALQKRTQVVAAKKILNSYINQDEHDLEAIKGWLGNIKSYTSDLQLASLLIAEENYTDASALLNLIPDLYNIEGEELELFNDDVLLLNINATLHQEGRNIMQLNNSEISQLESIANNERGMARSGARVILESFYGFNDYCDCIDRNEDKSIEFEWNEDETKTQTPLNIYANPNPAKDYVEFHYELSEIDTEGIIIITDINGKQIQMFNVNQIKGIKAWDTRNIPAGTYIITLKTKYFEISDKLIIQ